MKKILFLLSLCFLYSFQIAICAQDSQKSETLWVHDTRDTNEPPTFFKREIRADLKQLSTIGISTAYGFSTNLTISPWYDGSTGYIHQLNFNNDGIYYRNGDFSSPWNDWQKLLMGDKYGNLKFKNLSVDSLFEFGNKKNDTYSALVIHGPNSPVGESSKRDILFKFNEAGQSAIRAYRGSEWGTFLQFLTAQPGDDSGQPRVRMHIDQYGKVGIGTIDPVNELDVNGTIRAKEIKVESNWADFVFKKDYKLPTLKEVEAHINEKGTLPNIPNESTIKADGLNLSEMNVLLLQKVEELTLYILQQEKRIEAMESKINTALDKSN